jgi:hypothetical protein
MPLLGFSSKKLTRLQTRLSERWQNFWLSDFTNLYAGRRAVVIGNGPSLKTADLEKLHDVVTFASNKIYLAFEEVTWRPTVYTVCDSLLAEDNCAAILAADFSKSHILHSRVVLKYLRNQRGARFYEYRGYLPDWKPGQPAALRECITGGLFGGGYSVVIDQVQLAYAMGCSEVILIGVDFSYGGNLAQTGKTCSSGNVVETDGTRNHFHPRYYRAGDRHTVPKINEQIHAHRFCREAFESAGRCLINASRQTALTVLLRADFDELFPASI